VFIFKVINYTNGNSDEKSTEKQYPLAEPDGADESADGENQRRDLDHRASTIVVRGWASEQAPDCRLHIYMITDYMEYYYSRFP
jgi:hypothetical protein